MNESNQYDAAIIGGGLAGLSMAIQLSAKGYKVVLFEKETYPFTKVCGEYISMESWDFIQSLGLPLSTMQLPIIKQLIVSAPDGTMLKHRLPLGGFGISRFVLDAALKEIALSNGVEIFENCKVEDASFDGSSFHLQTRQGLYQSKVCAGSFGKRSNLDIKWKRSFISRRDTQLNNFIGVKYHIKTIFPEDTIALHNFKNGYCGISKIEEDKYCLCYLTTAKNLKASNNSISQMEQNILQNNPALKDIFESATFLNQTPITISQISFHKKEQVSNHILLVGDAAGMITPLCGNGMSMALHASKLAALQIEAFLEQRISRKQMEKNYCLEWKKNFTQRLFVGRLVQRFFGKEWLTNFFVRSMNILPWLTTALIRQTHGKAY
jgi:menaquinone-9 beta-reductase